MTVFCLGTEDTQRLWPKYAHHLDRLETESGLLLASVVKDDLRQGLRQLWGSQQGDDVTGVVITHIYDTPKGKTCEITGACGTQRHATEIDELLAEIERWALSIGCTRIRLQGRKGWQRRLKGYADAGIILEKFL